MGWIESHQNMERHPKTIGLRRFVGWNLNETIGFLHRFWWWALDAAPDGVVTDVCQPGVCGEVFGLSSDIGDKLMAGMAKVGWLDTRDDGTIIIHNHQKYRGRLSELREQARIRQQNRRNRMKEGELHENEEDIDEDGSSRKTSRQHNTTQHNTTQQTTPSGEAKTPASPGGKAKVEWNGSNFSVPDVFYDKWEAAYPGVNVAKEINKAAAWLVANPKKAKKDYGRFLNGWIGRAKPELVADDSYSLDPVLEEWAEEHVERQRLEAEAQAGAAE